jgi:hypothetical protein
MKSTLFTITKSFLFLLFLNSCSAPEVENDTTSTNNAKSYIYKKRLISVLTDR